MPKSLPAFLVAVACLFPTFALGATIAVDRTPAHADQLNWSYADVQNPSASFARFTNITKNVVYNFSIPLGATPTNESLRAGFSGGVRTGERWKAEIISDGVAVSNVYTFTIGTIPSSVVTSAYTPVQAESYSAMQGIQNNGVDISNLDTTDWVLYRNVDFGTQGAKGFIAHMAVTPQFAGGMIDVYLDTTATPPISRLVTVDTTSWTNFTDQAAVTTNTVTGTHDVYLAFTGTEVAALDSFKFSTTTPTNLNPVPPTARITVNGGKKNITVKAGDVVTKTWSSTGGSAYDATWSAAGTCADAGRTNQHWAGFDGKNPAGDTESFPSQVSQAGCTYAITYKVRNASGQTATDMITVTHSGGGAVVPPANCDTSKTVASVLEHWWDNYPMSATQSIQAGWINSYAFTAPPADYRYGEGFPLFYNSTVYVMSISSVPCDFSAALHPRCVAGGNINAMTTVAIQWYLDLGDSRPQRGMCPLTPDATYYVNVKTADGSAGTYWVF